MCYTVLGFGILSASGAEKAKWSVFIYMCGTNLESLDDVSNGTDNLKALLALDIPDNVNIVVTTGGTKEWEMEGIDPSKLQRFIIKLGKLELLEEYILQNMGESSTLSDFLLGG